ncbi:MAG: SDR family NAD(P)-dependent oxidoreductase [Sandaracinaceae bacterium]
MTGRVLVTGASRGIGRAIAERLLAQGRPVTAVARDEARLSTLSGADALAWDLRTPDGVVARAWDDFGPIEGVVYAAGLAEHQRLEHVTEAQLAAALDVHVRAPLRLMQDWVPRLRPSAGSAVFVTSTLASRPAPTTSVYAASKAALEAFVRTWAQELAPDGIRVNAVAPGVVDTDMVRALRLDPNAPAPSPDAVPGLVAEQLRGLSELHPLGRLGTADEVAQTVVHVLDAAWMTGSVVTLDGGLTAG